MLEIPSSVCCLLMLKSSCNYTCTHETRWDDWFKHIDNSRAWYKISVRLYYCTTICTLFRQRPTKNYNSPGFLFESNRLRNQHNWQNIELNRISRNNCYRWRLFRSHTQNHWSRRVWRWRINRNQWFKRFGNCGWFFYLSWRLHNLNRVLAGRLRPLSWLYYFLGLSRPNFWYIDKLGPSFDQHWWLFVNTIH